MKSIFVTAILIQIFAISLCPQTPNATERLYRVSVNDKSAFMNRSGKVVTVINDPAIEYLGDFSEGLAEFTNTKALGSYPFSKQGYIDVSGKIAIKAQFDQAYDFSDGRALVKNGDLYAFIDRTGKTIIQFPASCYVRDFHEGLAAVLEYSKFWYIDVDGKEVISPFPGLSKDFSEGLAAVYIHTDAGLKVGYMDKGGMIVIEPQFDEGTDFHDGAAAVKAGEKWCYIDKTGKRITEPIFKDVYDFSDGMARVSTGDKYGYIDRTGKLVIPEKFQLFSGDFSEGLAPACIEKNKCGYIDKTGKFNTEPVFYEALPFEGGLASVWTDALSRAYIDHSGKFVWRSKR